MPRTRYEYYRKQQRSVERNTEKNTEKNVERIRKTKTSVSYNKPKVHLALRELLGEQVTPRELDAFKIALLNATLDIPEQNICPCFINTFVRQGMITVICKNKFSAKWLRENATKWTVDKLQVRLVNPATELIKMTVVVPPPKRDILNVCFRLLSTQNGELRTDKWVILKRKELFSGTLLVLGMDEISTDYLKVHDYKAFMGCCRLFFRPTK